MEVKPELAKSKEQVESKKKKKQKEKKEKHQNFMKDLPHSAFSCTAHPTQYLRIFPKPNKNPPTCKSCGFKLEGKFGYLSCPKSANCFQLCTICKVCTQNHILRNMMSLRQFANNELYKENRYKCHGCQEEKVVEQGRGVWHCGPCSFSICPGCIERTDALWRDLQPDQ